MPKATNKQINYLNSLGSEDYSVLAIPSHQVINAVLKQNDYQSLSDLSREDASLLINLLSGASKYQSLHLNIKDTGGQSN